MAYNSTNHWSFPPQTSTTLKPNVEIYWPPNESSIAADFWPRSERLEPTEPPREIDVLRWCLHRNDPMWVVGEQRQFDLTLRDFVIFDNALGDINNRAAFFRSSKSNSDSSDLDDDVGVLQFVFPCFGSVLIGSIFFLEEIERWGLIRGFSRRWGVSHRWSVPEEIEKQRRSFNGGFLCSVLVPLGIGTEEFGLGIWRAFLREGLGG